jgi:hypothetical protein
MQKRNTAVTLALNKQTKENKHNLKPILKQTSAILYVSIFIWNFSTLLLTAMNP